MSCPVVYRFYKQQKGMMTKLSPRERGCIRHLRTLIEQYERTPETRYAVAMQRPVAELIEAAVAAEAQQKEKRDAEVAEALKDYQK